MTCPICNLPNDFGSKHFVPLGSCACPQDNVDRVLELLASPDVITPVSEMTGIPAGCIVAILALAMLAMVVYLK